MASRQLCDAKALIVQLPRTYGLLAVGAISGWTAHLVIRETAVLDPPTRARADEVLASTLPSLSPRQAEAAARRVCIELDQSAVVRRAAKATSDRRVWIRPAPDTMAVISALVPVAQGVACWASLVTTAKAAKTTGDPRSLDQIRADTFVERLTGQATADAVPVTLNITMVADSLLDGDDRTAAVLDGYGPIPAAVGRDLATRGADRDVATGNTAGDAERVRTFIRRIFTDPLDDTVMAVDPSARLFTGALARFIRTRDQHRRTPWCGAPIHDIDHTVRHADGGQTTAENGSGVCQRCNLVKEMPGWHLTPHDADGVSTITTPTGHTYPSTPPPALGHGGLHGRPGRQGPKRRRLAAATTGREPPDG